MARTFITSSISTFNRFVVREKRGFTLIELLAVTAIMTVITGITLSNNAKFGGIITLRNLAYDIALTFREAQTYGISVRKFGSGSGSFGAGYGVFMETANPASYIMFADVNGDGHYSGCPNEAQCELAQSLSIGRGFYISDICATPVGGTESCGQTKVDVLFKRPEPDAEIRINDGASLNERARIVLSSPRGDLASVVLEATGQISITSM